MEVWSKIGVGILRDKWFIFSLKVGKSRILFHDLRIRNSVMAFMVGHFALLDKQYLWGFMRDAKALRDPIGYRSESDQIQVVWGDSFRIFFFPVSQKPIQRHAADGAAGAVFE